MGNVLDCASDPTEEINFEELEGPIMKPFHAMSIKELAYNVKYEASEDAKKYGGSLQEREGVVEQVEEQTTIDDSEVSTSMSVLEPQSVLETETSTEYIRTSGIHGRE